MKIKVIISAVALASTLGSNPGNAASAVAVGRNGPRWWACPAMNYSTIAEAQYRALTMCAQRGPGCSIVTMFARACFAIAVQLSNSGYSWATRQTIEEARSVVLSQCLARGWPCEIKLSFCDTTMASPPPVSPPPAPPPIPAASPPPPQRGRGCDLYPELCE
jgi:Domain of unknown function (DUF4189)